MNIYPPLTEKSSEYSHYYSLFKSAGRRLVPDATETRFNDWMNNIVAKFPYFMHTSPGVMAIASLLADSGRFNTTRAKDLIHILFGDKEIVIIDVKRYYDHLTG